MKKTNKIISLILAVIMIFSAVAVQALAVEAGFYENYEVKGFNTDDSGRLYGISVSYNIPSYKQQSGIAFTFEDTPLSSGEDYKVVHYLENGTAILAKITYEGEKVYVESILRGEDWELYDCYEMDAESWCDCRCHSTDKFTKFINKILFIIWKIFGKNAACQCGMAHW